MFNTILHLFKRKKRIKVIEERLSILKDVYSYYKTLNLFSVELLAEKVNDKDVDGFDKIITAQNRALTVMFKVEEETKQLEKELRMLR